MGACLSVICIDDGESRSSNDHRYENNGLYESRRAPLPAISTADKKSSSSNSPDRQRTPTAHRDTLTPKDAAERQQYAATATSPAISPTACAEAAATSQPAAARSPKVSWTKGELIGAGAFGRVFSGLNNQTGELIAVKQVGISKDEGVTRKVGEHVRALEAEVALLKTLRHENIVQYLGMERTDDAVNILLEYVPGGSIASILSKFGPLKENIIQIYTKQILQGLEYLHQQGIMHRDIKGANILIDNKGTVKLADFGASKRIEDLATIAGANSVRGTPYWMAPEVIKGLGHGRPADIWSLGCTVIEMATGKPPWSNYAAPVTAMFQIASSKDPPQFPAALSKDAHDFLTLCFNRVPNQRPNATTLLQHPFIAGAPARPSTAQFPQTPVHQQQLLQQQPVLRTQQHVVVHVGAPLLPVPEQQNSGRLPPLTKPPPGVAAKAAPRQMSPSKRAAQLAAEPSNGLPASSQPLQANRPQLPQQASPRLQPQASPRLPNAAAAGAAAQHPTSSSRMQQQQQPAAGPARPSTAPLPPTAPAAGMQHHRQVQGSSMLLANLPPPPPPIRIHPAPTAQSSQHDLPCPSPQQQELQPASAPAAIAHPKLRESFRPNFAASYTTLDYNPIEEPSWMPGYMNMQTAAAVQAAAAAAAASVTSSTTMTSSFSRNSSRRNTVYDDDDDQQTIKTGRYSPTKTAATVPAAAIQQQQTGRYSPTKTAAVDRKPQTPRSSPLSPVPADAAAPNDTESDVDQPARPLGNAVPSVTPKAAGAKPADGRAHGRMNGAAAMSDMLKSKKEMYEMELELELQQARRNMRATLQLGGKD